MKFITLKEAVTMIHKLEKSFFKALLTLQKIFQASKARKTDIEYHDSISQDF